MHAGEGSAMDAVVFYLGAADVLGALFIQLCNRDCVGGSVIVASSLMFFKFGHFLYIIVTERKSIFHF